MVGCFGNRTSSAREAGPEEVANEVMNAGRLQRVANAGKAVTVPPLRDLKTTKRALHPDALQQVMSYSFPGNVRELRNLLERACILTSGPEILWFDLPEVQDETHVESGLPVFNGASLPEEFHLRSTLASWERRIIEQTLTKTNGSKTAQMCAGLTRPLLSGVPPPSCPLWARRVFLCRLYLRQLFF